MGRKRFNYKPILNKERNSAISRCVHVKVASKKWLKPYWVNHWCNLYLKKYWRL